MPKKRSRDCIEVRSCLDAENHDFVTMKQAEIRFKKGQRLLVGEVVNEIISELRKVKKD